MLSKILQIIVTLSLLISCQPNASGQAFTSLYSFLNTPDGELPNGNNLIWVNGVLYGTTVAGGTGGAGTLFSLTPPQSPGGAWAENIVWNFGLASGDNGSPSGGLVADGNGVFYGVAQFESGYVFSMTPPSTSGGQWTEQILYQFQGPPGDGSHPNAGLILGPGGELYGTTQYGGSATKTYGNGLGTVFSLTPPESGGGQWTERIIWSNGGGLNGSNCFAIGQPIHHHYRCRSDNGVVIDANGVLYGATYAGGAFDRGMVFSLTPSNGGRLWTWAVLHSFRGNNEAEFPLGGLSLGQNGVLYGTTSQGGKPQFNGTVFSLSPPANAGGTWTRTVLYRFPKRGKRPYSGSKPAFNLVLSAVVPGRIYGMTLHGGGYGLGSIFELQQNSPGKWKAAGLHAFDTSDGLYPMSLIEDQTGTLYGETRRGGSGGHGTVFSLAP